MTPRLVSLELEAFRGFAKRRQFDLDGDAILIRGDNGTGKTSLVDGILWLFTGHLTYLEDRVRKLRTGEDVIGSRFTGKPARVTLDVRVDGEVIRFSRSGNQKTTELSAFANGVELANPGSLLAQTFGQESPASLSNAVATWGLLRQDAVRVTLDEAGGPLHDRLASMVGLEELSGFSSAVAQSARVLATEKRAAAASLAALRKRHDDAKALAGSQAGRSADATNQPSFWADVTALLEGLPAGVTVDVEQDGGIEGLQNIGSALRDLFEVLESMLDARRAGAEAERALLSNDLPAERGRVELAEAELDRVRKAGPTTARLAESALALLAGDECPVCQQPVDGTDLRARLKLVARASKDFAEATDAAAAELREAIAALSRTLALQERQRLLKGRAVAAEAAVLEVVAQTNGALSFDPARVREVEALTSTVVNLDSILRGLRKVWTAAAAATEIRADRFAGELSALASELSTAQDAYTEVEKRYERAKALEKDVNSATKTIVAKALADLEPGFAEVFDRLTPNPAFTELRARQDILRNVNQVVPSVRDRLRGVEANPLLVFSEGQLNVVALSYFLGMALNAEEGALPFLVLDDPLQAMDTVAVLGFGDLCRRLRDHRQLIITTHDRRFADILDRKLAPRAALRRTVVHEFDGWTRDGPLVRTTNPEFAEIIQLVERRAS